MEAPSLTILAPTHDRPEVLDRVWPSWLEQQGLREIVVVNDGSARDYAAVFARMATACGARGVMFRPLVLPVRRGAPAARNAGLDLCTSDEILTTDDDVVLDARMVERCRAQRPSGAGAVIAGPRVVYLRDGEQQDEADRRSRADRSEYFRNGDLTLVPWVDPGRALQVPFVTAIALWPRSLFQRGLRYFEGYGGNGYREETDPQIRAQSSFDASVWFIPDAVSYHLPPAVAYADRSGQRRHGPLWFEYWVVANNLKFLHRHRQYFREVLGVSTWRCVLSMIRARFGARRVRKFLGTALARR